MLCIILVYIDTCTLHVRRLIYNGQQPSVYMHIKNKYCQHTGKSSLFLTILLIIKGGADIKTIVCVPQDKTKNSSCFDTIYFINKHKKPSECKFF